MNCGLIIGFIVGFVSGFFTMSLLVVARGN